MFVLTQINYMIGKHNPGCMLTTRNPAALSDSVSLFTIPLLIIFLLLPHYILFLKFSVDHLRKPWHLFFLSRKADERVLPLLHSQPSPRTSTNAESWPARYAEFRLILITFATPQIKLIKHKDSIIGRLAIPNTETQCLLLISPLIFKFD